MAFVAQQVPDYEQNQFGRKDQTTPNPIPPQTGGSSGGGQGGTGTAPGFASPTQFGSNAAKLSDYLAANKDQVGQFGQRVAGNLTQGYNDTVGAINQGTQQFGQQVGQGYTPYDATTVNKAATDPSGFAKDPNNVSKFQSIYNDQYSGPQNFEGSNTYAGINDQVNKAVENAGLTNNAAGLGTYLNTRMGANDNTEGMRSLDTALLLGNKDSSKAISDAAAPYQNLQTYLSGQTQNANAGIQTAKQAADQARQTTQNQFTGQNGVIPSFQKDVNNRLATNQKSFNTALSAMQDPEYLRDSNVLGTLYGEKEPSAADLMAPTVQNTASPNDYATMSALNQLTGSGSTFLPGQMASDYKQFSVPNYMGPNGMGIQGELGQRDNDLMRRALSGDVQGPGGVQNQTDLTNYLASLRGNQGIANDLNGKATIDPAHLEAYKAMVRQGLFDNSLLTDPSSAWNAGQIAMPNEPAWYLAPPSTPPPTSGYGSGGGYGNGINYQNP